ncbi:MAG: hypothetical protein AAGG69_00870 [Pseudomonadota bacterium]
MSLSRRKFLGLVGGGVVVAAGAGAATFINTRTPHAALAPWDQAGNYDDARLRALSYALLAPNPHNRQPWEAELVGKSVSQYGATKPVTCPSQTLLAANSPSAWGAFLN